MIGEDATPEFNSSDDPTEETSDWERAVMGACTVKPHQDVVRDTFSI